MNYTEKNKLLDKISVIGLMAIFVEVFLYAVDRCYTDAISDWLLKMPTILNVIGGVFLIVSICMYILAYRKLNHSKLIYATEFLFLALLCPFLTYWYLHATGPLRNISPKTMWIAVLIYYICRIVYACVKAYMSSNDRQLKKKKN